MKTITVSPQSAEVHALLEQARDDDLILRTEDGDEFMIVAIDDFDLEIARTRQNAKLMALLDERARQPERIPLEQVKREIENWE
jgi:hypothetical protein